MKICTKCGKVKEEGEFHRNRSIKDGLNCWCKICFKEYYKNNVKKKKEYNKEYYKSNAEKLNKHQKEYYRTNTEKRKEYLKEYRKNNVEKVKEYSKEYNKEYRNSSALYDTFAHQISYADEVRRDPKNGELLQIKCTYCKEWFNPTAKNIQSRISALEGKGTGECRLYCSDECKKLCPIHGQRKYPKDQKPYVSRNVQKEWAEMVKERDGYKCIKCGSTEGLIAHHREGIRWNPLESADIDIGVTLCEECNKRAHSIEGCSYSDMRCNNKDV